MERKPQNTPNDALLDDGTSDLTEGMGSTTRSAEAAGGGRVESRSLDNSYDRDRRTQSAPNSGRLRRMVLANRTPKELGADGSEYLQVLKSSLEKDENYPLSLMPLGVDGLHLAHDGSNGYFVMFNELQRSPDVNNEFVPACSHLDRLTNDPIVTEQLRKSNISPMGAMLVHQTDYTDNNNDKVLARTIGRLTASNLRNIVSSGIGADLTMEDLAYYPLRIIVNQEEVRERLAANYPGGVLPYYQVGFVIDICTDERARADRQNNNYREDQYNWEFLAMVGVTTEFMDNLENARYDRDEKRYQPICSITACTSIMTTIKMHPLLLAITQEVMIRQQYWHLPFRNPSPDVNSGINIGSLEIDENGVPKQLKDQNSFQRFLDEYVNDPVLAVDVRYGAINHPALEVLCERDSNLLLDELSEMDPDNILDHSLLRDEVLFASTFYTGLVHDNSGDGQMVDTRAIDYFRVVYGVKDEMLLNRFRGYYENPEDRIRAIAEAGWRTPIGSNRNAKRAMESLYSTTKYVLNSDAIVEMSKMRGLLNIITNVKQYNNLAFDFSTLANHARILRRGNRSYSESSRGSHISRGYGNYYGRRGGR